VGIPDIMFVHIAMGTIGLASGAAALVYRKGGFGHRVAGTVFLLSMMLMSVSGAALAVLTPAAATFNVVIGGLTFYLVATSWATVMRRPGESGAFEIGALLAALSIAGLGFGAGLVADSSAEGELDRLPALLYFIFGAVAAFAAALDLTVIVRGGVSGAQRIARHLWRMCFALLLAAIAFFIGQGAKVFPDAVRETNVLFAPVIAVIVLMVFWLFRVLLTNWHREATKPD
jgi:hypothetical protein